LTKLFKGKHLLVSELFGFAERRSFASSSGNLGEV